MVTVSLFLFRFATYKMIPMKVIKHVASNQQIAYGLSSTGGGGAGSTSSFWLIPQREYKEKKFCLAKKKDYRKERYLYILKERGQVNTCGNCVTIGQKTQTWEKQFLGSLSSSPPPTHPRTSYLPSPKTIIERFVLMSADAYLIKKKHTQIHYLGLVNFSLYNINKQI